MNKTYISILCNIVIRCSGVLLNILSNYLIASKFNSGSVGYYFTFISLNAIMMQFCLCGTLEGLNKYLAKENITEFEFNKKLSSLIFVFMVPSIVITSLLMFSSNYISNFIFGDVLFAERYLIISLPFLCFLYFCQSFLQSQEKVLFGSAIISIVQPGILSLLIIVSAYNSLISIEICYFISVFISTCIIFCISFHNGMRFHLKSVDSIFIKKQLPVLKRFLSVNLLGNIISNAPIIIGGKYLGAELIGVISIAQRVILSLSISLSSVNMVLMPKISKLYKSNKLKEIKLIIVKASGIMTLVSVPICAIVMFFSKDIMIFFNQTYADHHQVIDILLIGQVINIITGPVGITLLMVDKERILIKNQILTIIMVAAFFIYSLLDANLYIFAMCLSMIVSINNILNYISIRGILR